MNFSKTVKCLNLKEDILQREIDYLEYYSKNNMQIEQQSIQDINRSILEKKEKIKIIKSRLDKIMNDSREKDISSFLNKVILGDCTEYLSKIPRNSVHMFLSDIPYGINLDDWDVLHDNTNSALLGSSPAQEGKSAFKRRGKPINGWNKEDRQINQSYHDWVYSWAQQLFPVMKEGSPVLIFGARRTISSAITAMERAGFLLKDILSWEKSNAHHRSQDIFKVLIKRGTCYKFTEKSFEEMENIEGLDVVASSLECLLNVNFDGYNSLLQAIKQINPQITKKFSYQLLELALADKKVKKEIEKWKGWKLGNLAPYYEPIAWFFKPYDSVVTLTDNILINEVGALNMNVAKVNDKEPNNILKFDFLPDEERYHDAQKPLELMKYLINIMTRKGQIVLDPFVGSGTTAVAAKELGRDFISFEIAPKYCEVANKRLTLKENTEKQMSLDI
ncbi:DNA-methyltransferase [Sporolactobacillus terrae]|uniref:DNA-methyltransferase n=1 Tax=Sporolactobacillus terrae TaxID=269673 RepID=UPI001CC01143|nr:DNA methyltransferase [Sporolactobacillus terrae]UAK16125.1 site-specific DNA-methyltransferase [Sporolactobacillus terrae]